MSRIKKSGKRLIGTIKSIQHEIADFYSEKYNTKNLLIFSLGRSGSTYLTNRLAQKYSIADLGEPLQFPPISCHRFLKHAFRRNPYSSVAKILSYQISQSTLKTYDIRALVDAELVLDTILILKRDLFEQICSAIYSEVTGIYHQKKESNIEAISVSYDVFERQFHHSILQQRILDDFTNDIGLTTQIVDFTYIGSYELPSDQATLLTKSHEATIQRKAKRLKGESVRDRIRNVSDLEKLYYELVS